jgi:Mg-chelatase subunit ChlD
VLAASSGRRELAADLLASLTTPAGQRTVMTAGFRDARGAPSPVVGTDAGADGAQVVATSPVSGEALDLAERTLAVVNQDASLLAVMDVSGSMAWPMSGPDGSGPSRIRIATRAAAEGMSLYPDSTAVGLWLFPKPGDDRAHQEVAPVAPLAQGDRRRRLARTLGGIQAIPGGNTPLYAATAAAVRAQQRSWQPDKINAVIVLSDGANTIERAGGLSGLLDELRAAKASRRPVPVITVAFGPEADAASLARISRASGGVAYRASEGRGVREIFLDALGQRVCRPDCS